MRSCARNNRAGYRRRAGRWIGVPAPVLSLLAAGLFLGQCFAWRSDGGDPGTQGAAALQAGNYVQARAQFEAALRDRPDDAQLLRGLLAVLRETGQYREAIRHADGFLARNEGHPGVHFERGRSAAAVGEYAEAEEHLRRSLALAAGTAGFRSGDAVRELALLADVSGRTAEAADLWESLLAEYRRGRARQKGDLGNVALAAWKRGYIQDARDLFLDATAPAEGEAVPPEALADFGYLFLEKYNATEAIDVFRDCLKINGSYPPALVGVAMAKRYESSPEVELLARTALEVNPSFVPALTLLAELRYEQEDYSGGRELVRRALAVNPKDLHALTLEGVFHHVAGAAERFAEVERRVFEIHAGYGRFHSELAESLVMRRKYDEAVGFYRRALQVDPRHWAAYSGLGMNLMRTGDLQEGRKMIAAAFEGDPYNVWAFNTLSLLDQMDGFVRVRSDNFVYLLDREDEPVLSVYAPRLAEEVYGKLTARYGFKPRGVVQVEIFPDHGGFAVRTLGLPGLGALGVCFGKVIAMDSPRARKPGEFNWGSTLWHEFVHVITLQMTNHNIPRWYSEGLSVYEERRARPGWGDDLTAAIVRAYQEGKLLKVSELNAGLMRPRFPEQIAYSYYQASLFCELIEQRFGFDKIRQTLELFAAGKAPEEVFRAALGWSPQEMDAEYARFLDEKLGAPARRLRFEGAAEGGTGRRSTPDRRALAERIGDNPEDFFAHLHLGMLLHEAKENSGAETHLKRAIDLFPEFVEPRNPYEILGALYLEERRPDEALEMFLRWSDFDEEAVTPLALAAEIYRQRKDWAGCIRMLERSVYLDPYDRQVHRVMSEAAMEAEDWPLAVTAGRVLLGLNPPDRAAAHFNLAKAWLGLGDRAEARRETLKALELAPAYREAQQLLLKLRGANP